MLDQGISTIELTPVCKTWQGARRDFRGRRNPAPNQGAERPGAAQFLCPNGIIVPGAANFHLFLISASRFLPLPRFLPRFVMAAPTRSRRNLPCFADWGILSPCFKTGRDYTLNFWALKFIKIRAPWALDAQGALNRGGALGAEGAQLKF